jgi:hypothetical protein
VEGGFHQHFVKSTLLKLFCKVLRVWMYTSELMVSPCAQCLPKSPHLHITNVAMTHCWRSSFKLYLPSRRRVMPFHCQSFCLRFKGMDPRFIPSDDPLQKGFTIRLVIGQQI